MRTNGKKLDLSMYPVRDAGRPVQFGVPALDNHADEVERRLLRMMLVRYNEMKAVENVASTMYQTDGMPWAYYHDLARHRWDEVRHSCFGEVMIEQLGHDLAEVPFVIGNSVFYSMVSPIERYAFLGIAIEGSLMKYPPGKRLDFEWCRDVTRHPLATVFQDFDWADEVLHTQIARHWVGAQFGGDLTRARAIAADVQARFQQFQEEQVAAEHAAANGQVGVTPPATSATESAPME